MGFSYFNPNPEGKQVGDCTVNVCRSFVCRSTKRNKVVIKHNNKPLELLSTTKVELVCKYRLTVENV